MVEQFFSSNRFNSNKPSPLGFFIFGFEEKPDMYPSQEKLLSQLMIAQNSDLLDVNYLDLSTKGSTSLHLAAQMGCISSLKYLLNRKMYGNPERVDDSEQNPLHHAARRGHDEIVSTLLEEQGYPNLVNNKHQCTGMTALHLAAVNGHTKTVKILLEYEADINLKSKMGSTALVEAALNEHAETVKFLLSRLPLSSADNDVDPNFTALINLIYQTPSDDSSSFKIGVSLLQELLNQKFILENLALQSDQSLYLAGQEVNKS